MLQSAQANTGRCAVVFALVPLRSLGSHAVVFALVVSGFSAEISHKLPWAARTTTVESTHRSVLAFKTIARAG